MSMALNTYYTAFHPAYLLVLVSKGLETERFSQMITAFTNSVPKGKRGLPLEEKSRRSRKPFNQAIPKRYMRTT